MPRRAAKDKASEKIEQIAMDEEEEGEAVMTPKQSRQRRSRTSGKKTRQRASRKRRVHQILTEKDTLEELLRTLSARHKKKRYSCKGRRKKSKSKRRRKSKRRVARKRLRFFPTVKRHTSSTLDARAFEEKVEEFRLFSNKVLKLMCHEVEGLRDRDTVQVVSSSTLAELQAVAAQHKASLCREVEAALRKGT